MTVPGRNTAAAPISRRRRDVVGRDHAADDDHDVVAAEVGERPLERGEQGQVPGGQRADPDDVHVAVDGLLGDLLGRGEQRAHVDVEAEVGEGGDDDLLAAVVAVLAHLGDQDARAAALLRLELLGGGEHLRDGPRRRRPRTRYTPLIVRISARCRPQTFSRASEISPTVALARAASTAEREQVALRRS